MPIEIKELIIRASVREEPGNTEREESQPGASAGSGKPQEERIVARCVEQVMDILRIQNER